MGDTPHPQGLRHPLRRLIRFEAYGILFLLAGLFGALLATTAFDSTLVILLIFIAASSAFGFVINDISDIALDSRAQKPRNPLADGSLSCRTAKVISALLLAISVGCMALLPPHLLGLELAVLFVFITYSFWIEVKNIAVLDLIYHALFPALYGWLGFVLFHPLDLTGIVYVILLGIFGAVGELGNEIRDLEKDRLERKNTVVVIGERPAFILTISLLVAALVIIAVYALLQPGFLWLLPFVPFGAFLVQPVVLAMHDHEYRARFVDSINFRAIILAAAMLLVYGFCRMNGWC
ncbi:MAG: UbiA family prenyltransferase [Methanomicrobiales archaeon]|nr:UbiA family prenyltransferase [Methanomicrobiales archaeon]